MQLGTEFLKSKIARRFCLLFILCAFVPTLVLVVLSYNKVIDQLEEQSLNRLKREAKAYGFSLFDRMIRLDNELQIIGRNIEDGKKTNPGNKDLLSYESEPLFSGVHLYSEEKKILPVFGTMDTEVIKSLWKDDLQKHDKPFILSLTRPGENGRVFFGTNIRKTDKDSFSIIGEVRPEYLWGVGPSPILPPMTELSVYDKNGSSIMASMNAPAGNYEELPDQQSSQEPGVFRFEKNGKIFFSSTSNLFVEARFQPTGWRIFLSQARGDAMSSVENFKQSFPFIILLFLLLILYLSLLFIRKGLEPLEQLKEGTKRIALKDFSKNVDIRSGDEFEELGESFNKMAGKLDTQFHALNVLGEIDRAILSSVGKSQILATTLQSLKIFFRCDIVLFVTNTVVTKGHVNVYIMQGQRKNDPHRKHFALEEDEHEKLFIDSDHEILTDKKSYPEFLKRINGGQFSKLLYLPLKIGGKVNRVLILGWLENHSFKEDELNQARQVANQLAVALTNSKLLEDMESLAMGTIQALARTVDAKSKWTSGHSERVSALGGRIAKVMGISEKEIDTITRGGLLHDIGKIGIPVAILDKPAGLTDKEFAEIKNHPTIGAKILEPITAYHDILPLVLHHHEKFDGSGYPDGLKGDEIDIRARILAVADVWDALVSDRPYREGWVQDRAKKMIVDGSGTHFDPKVVEAFTAIMDMG